VCLWSEKTTVCRIFNCQRALLVGGQAPKLLLATLKSRICLRRRPVGCASGPLFALSRLASQAALTASLTLATTNQRSRRRLQRTRRSCYAPKLFSKNARLRALALRRGLLGLVMTPLIRCRSQPTQIFIQPSPSSFANRSSLPSGFLQTKLQRSEGWWRIPGSNR
jgi:hypothetical protein